MNVLQNSSFVIQNFLVFDTQFLVFNAKFIIFTHVTCVETGGFEDRHEVVLLDEVVEQPRGEELVRWRRRVRAVRVRLLLLGVDVLEEVLEHVRAGPVAEVVAEAGELDARDVLVGDVQLRLLVAEVPREPAAQVRGADAMLEAVVGGAGEDVVDAAELLEVFQPLELRRVDHRDADRRQRDVAVHRVVEYLVLPGPGPERGRVQLLRGVPEAAAERRGYVLGHVALELLQRRPPGNLRPGQLAVAHRGDDPAVEPLLLQPPADGVGVPAAEGARVHGDRASDCRATGAVGNLILEGDLINQI